MILLLQPFINKNMTQEAVHYSDLTIVKGGSQLHFVEHTSSHYCFNNHMCLKVSLSIWGHRGRLSHIVAFLPSSVLLFSTLRCVNYGEEDDDSFLTSFCQAVILTSCVIIKPVGNCPVNAILLCILTPNTFYLSRGHNEGL